MSTKVFVEIGVHNLRGSTELYINGMLPRFRYYSFSGHKIKEPFQAKGNHVNNSPKMNLNKSDLAQNQRKYLKKLLGEFEQRIANRESDLMIRYIHNILTQIKKLSPPVVEVSFFYTNLNSIYIKLDG